MKSDNFSTLFDSPNYRVFLQDYILIKDIKLSDFARLVGCTRGFPSDILKGRRRLTAKSYYSFEKALKLPLPYKKMFQLLVAKEEPDIFAHIIDMQTIDIKIESLKQNRISQKNHSTFVQNNENDLAFQKILNNPHTMSVVAAAGDPESGATLQQIQQRTRLTDHNLNKTLNDLREYGLLKQVHDRYYPQDLHLFFQTKNTSEMLSKFFHQAMRSAEKRLSQINDQSSEMFFVSEFCIQENQMPQFKKELKGLVLKFIDDSIAAEGTRVAKLLTALHF